MNDKKLWGKFLVVSLLTLRWLESQDKPEFLSSSALGKKAETGSGFEPMATPFIGDNSALKRSLKANM